MTSGSPRSSPRASETPRSPDALRSARLFAGQGRAGPALSRGEDAHRAARLQGDRAIEFLAAGGVALCLLELGDVAGAERWLGNATAAAAAQTRSRSFSSRPGAAWSARAPGTPRACASISRRPSRWRRRGSGVGACEALARLAIEASLLRTLGNAPDQPLVELIERSATQVKELLPLLPGHAPWGAQADAALATVALARGDFPGRGDGRRRSPPGLAAGLQRTSAWRSSSPRHERCSRAARRNPGKGAGLPPAMLSDRPGTADERIRVAWLTGPVGREIVELAGPMEDCPSGRTRPRIRDRTSRQRRRDSRAGCSTPDRGQDQCRDRNGDRARKRRTWPSGSPSSSPASERQAAPRRPRWRSAGSPPSGRADGDPGARRPPQVRRRGQPHHPRPDGLRLARGRLRQGGRRRA